MDRRYIEPTLNPGSGSRTWKVKKERERERETDTADPSKICHVRFLSFRVVTVQQFIKPVLRDKICSSDLKKNEKKGNSMQLKDLLAFLYV